MFHVTQHRDGVENESGGGDMEGGGEGGKEEKLN